jgi:hypothetical protein
LEKFLVRFSESNDVRKKRGLEASVFLLINGNDTTPQGFHPGKSLDQELREIAQTEKKAYGSRPPDRTSVRAG